MKKLFFLLLISSNIFAQSEMPTNEPLFPLPINTEGRVSYEGVVELANISKDELYDRSRVWLATAFNSSKAIIDFSDKESGKTISKVAATTYVKSLGKTSFIGSWHYTFTIIVKDSKYKYVITDFYHVNDTNVAGCKSVGAIENSEEQVHGLTCPNRKQLKEMKTILAVETSALINALKSNMSKKSVSDF